MASILDTLLPDAAPAPPREKNPLESVKLKLMALHDSLSTFLETADPATERDWKSILAHFNTLIARYESMTDTLQDEGLQPLLRSLIVVPQALPESDPDFVPRELLKTRLLQDVLDAEAALAERLNEALAGDAPIETANALDQTALRSELRAWAKLADAHDKVAAHAETFVAEFRMYDLKKRIPEEAAGQADLTPAQIQTKLEETMRWVTFGK
ncbi:hypothetical protein BC830DRAFT_134581 [Chytriomyces sp. MP71]|nr:hypothetical protein BC830DRAFT_134581 [Chytriomyces sp. MP71]